MSKNITNVESSCRVCGCTWHNACVNPDGSTCYWTEPGLCSTCAEKISVGIFEKTGRITNEELVALRTTRARSDAKELLIKYFDISGNYEVGDTMVQTNMPVVAGDKLRFATKQGYFFYLVLADGKEMTMADVLYPTL